MDLYIPTADLDDDADEAVEAALLAAEEAITAETLTHVVTETANDLAEQINEILGDEADDNLRDQIETALLGVRAELRDAAIAAYTDFAAAWYPSGDGADVYYAGPFMCRGQDCYTERTIDPPRYFCSVCGNDVRPPSVRWSAGDGPLAEALAEVQLATDASLQRVTDEVAEDELWREALAPEGELAAILLTRGVEAAAAFAAEAAVEAAENYITVTTAGLKQELAEAAAASLEDSLADTLAKLIAAEQLETVSDVLAAITARCGEITATDEITAAVEWALAP